MNSSIFRRKKISSIELVGILLLSSSSALSAEESSGSGTFTTLQGVTVTATRTEREAFDVPESVSIVDQQQIEREQPQNFGQILQYLPNVDIAGGPRSIGNQVNIRGLSDDRILFLIDGARQNFSRGHNSSVFLDPELLKKVEVVRGPASAVWGSGALGGVVAFTTKDAADMLAPGERFGARIKGGYQSVNSQWLGSTSIYGVAGDSFDYLFDFSYRNAGDIELGSGRKLKNSGFESYAGLAKLTWSPDPFNTVAFSALTFDQAGEVPSNPQTLSTPDNLVDRDTEQRNFALRYSYNDPDNRYLEPELLVYFNTTHTDETRQVDSRHDITEFETIGVNARNSMRFGDSGFVDQRLSYGLDFYHDEAEGQRNGSRRDSFPGGQSDVIGLYVQDEITLWNRLTVIPGVRWDRFENQSSDSLIPDQAEDAFSFKAGSNLAVTDWLSINAAYNEAFRAPNLGELFVSGTHFTCGPGCANLFVPNPNLKPEKAHNIDVGFRLHRDSLFLDDDRARFRAVYFHNEVTNFIDTEVVFAFHPVPGNPGLGGTTTNRNVRDALLEGFEVELSYDMPYGYTGVAYSQTRGDDETTHQPLSDIPADKWVVQAGLRYPPFDLALGWRARIVAAQDRVPIGGTPTGGYIVHDLNLAWTPTDAMFKDLRVNFGIDNLTNEDYRQHLSVLKQPGRNVMATVSYKY
jgi:hemoglobin/transferrin/lactoferrin receptor protein